MRSTTSSTTHLGTAALADAAISRAADAWLDDLRQRGRAENTLAAYAGDLRVYARAMSSLGIERLVDVGPDEVERCVLLLGEEPGRGGQPRSEATVARLLSAVRGLHGWLDEHGVAEDPTLGVPSPQAVRAAPAVLDLDEIAVLLAGPDLATSPTAVRDDALVGVLVATGVRAAEAAGLDVDDLDLDLGAVTVGTPRPRTLPISDPRALRAWLAVRDDDVQTPALFPSRRGGRLTRQGVWRVVTERAVACGLPAGTSPRILRSTYAAIERANGTPEDVLRERLGTGGAATDMTGEDRDE